MIFNNNTTTLGAYAPMVEGYDCSYGAALALVESARNDYSMFKAMLGVEAKALVMESTGYVNEDYIALQEATLSGIWGKIKELFIKLIGKIKAIFHTFMSKINNLFMSDKKMVKKYEKEVNRKTNLGNMDIKWAQLKQPLEERKSNDAKLSTTLRQMFLLTSSEPVNYKDKDSDERVEYWLSFYPELNNSDKSSAAEDYHDYYFDSEEIIQLKEANCGGIRGVMDFISRSEKIINNVKHYNDKVENLLNKFVKEVDKVAAAAAKEKIDKDDPEKEAHAEILQSRQEAANIAYAGAQDYQTAELMVCGFYMDAIKYKYKMYKAVFMKAIAANDKKLEESAIYLDAVAEAAADEVTDVIDDALSNEELSKICNASKYVKDADVSDDPNKLTYGPDYYTPNRSYVQTDGSVDSRINSKSESAYFGQMLY